VCLKSKTQIKLIKLARMALLSSRYLYKYSGPLRGCTEGVYRIRPEPIKGARKHKPEPPFLLTVKLVENTLSSPPTKSFFREHLFSARGPGEIFRMPGKIPVRCPAST